MVQQELFSSKFFFVSIFLLLMSCRGDNEMRWFDKTTVNLSTQQGVTTLEGKPFTGVVYQLHVNGDTAFVFSYYKGLKHGRHRSYYDNGKPEFVRYFSFGKKTGEHIGWYPNGIIRFLYHYENGEYHGNVKEWDMNGNLYRDFNYSQGQEEGLQKMWEVDGRLKANYVAKNGRKYGLAGSSNCINTVHED